MHAKNNAKFFILFFIYFPCVRFRTRFETGDDQTREKVSVTSSIVFDFATLDTTSFVILFQVIGEFFEWWSSQGIVLPEFWSQEIVGTADSLESSLGEVTEGGGTTTSTRK